MATFGKKITLYLIDGEASGRIMCELSNWSGKAYKIPRSMVNNSSDRLDLSNTGVYILFGKDELGNNLAYIGEAEHIYERLKQHVASKDFWQETIVFVSKDNNLNKAHAKYIECRLYELAKSANRYALANSTKPTKSTISEPDMAEMEEFIGNLMLLVGTLGHKIFSPQNNSKSTDNIFVIERKGLHAKGMLSEDGFIVLSNSTISTQLKTVSKSVEVLRQKYLDEGAIHQSSDEARLTKDILFSSPSLAATMVLGVSANGLKEWKQNGISLKDLGI